MSDAAAPAVAAAVTEIPQPTPATDTPPPAAVNGATTQEQKPAEPAQPQTYKMKVNGEVRELPADVVNNFAKAAGIDPKEAVDIIRLRSAAFAKFEEASKMRDEAAKARERIAQDPWAVIKEAGKDPDALAQERILMLMRHEQEKAQEANLPQEIRTALERGREAERRAAELEAKQKQDSQTRLQGQSKAHFDRWNQEMPKVMEAVGLPRTVEAARMVLGKMQVMLKAGVAPDLQVAAKAAAQELEQRNFALLRQLPPERLRDMLGKDTYAALLKLSVAQVQPSQPAQQKPPAQPADKKPKAWLSQREWDKQYLGE